MLGVVEVRIIVVQRILYCGPLDDFDEQTDQLMDALMDLHDITDPDIAVSLTEGIIDVSMIVEVDAFDEAANKSRSAVRSAIHAIGGWTPGWDGQVREAKVLTDAC